MIEYISKQLVESTFRNARKSMKPENYKGDEFFILDSILLNAEQIVHLMQAADVAPVMHGEIVDMRKAEDDGGWRCARCGWQYTVCVCGKDVTRKIHYCPNCGAKMDGEV